MDVVMVMSMMMDLLLLVDAGVRSKRNLCQDVMFRDLYLKLESHNTRLYLCLFVNCSWQYWLTECDPGDVAVLASHAAVARGGDADFRRVVAIVEELNSQGAEGFAIQTDFLLRTKCSY